MPPSVGREASRCRSLVHQITVNRNISWYLSFPQCSGYRFAIGDMEHSGVPHRLFLEHIFQSWEELSRIGSQHRLHLLSRPRHERTDRAHWDAESFGDLA